MPPAGPGSETARLAATDAVAQIGQRLVGQPDAELAARGQTLRARLRYLAQGSDTAFLVRLELVLIEALQADRARSTASTPDDSAPAPPGEDAPGACGRASVG